MKKCISLVLLVAMLVTMIPSLAWGAESPPVIKTAIQGDLEVTVRMDFPLSFDKVDSANMNVALLHNDVEITSVALEAKPSQTKPFTFDKKPYQVQVEARNEAGLDMSNEEYVAYYKLNFMQLPVGKYRVKFTGKGYTDYTSEPIVIDDYAKHIIVGTNDGTFSVGDIDGDNKVTQEDLKTLEQVLNKSTKNAADYELADLNKDGKIDVTDMAYIYYNIGLEGQAEIVDTKLININFDQEAMKKAGLSTADIQTLLNPASDAVVELSNKADTPISSDTPVQLPIEFVQPVEMEQIRLETSASGIAPTTGTAEVYDENGKIITTVEFDSSIPEGIELLTRNGDRQVVSIDLGKKVAVKRVVIKITGTTDPTSSIAEVAKVEFLKDIVPDNPQSTTGFVKGFTAEGKDESVVLSWNNVPNMTGYKVSYGTASGSYSQEVVTDKNTITITGLKNLQSYYFVVQATNGSWIGPMSSELMATPEAPSKPEAPKGVNLSTDDQMLTVTWSKSKNANAYHVYYKQEQEKTYTKVAASSETRHVLTNLNNDVKYYVYVTASNELGESGPSSTEVATPKKEIIEAPNVPKVKQIDKSHIVDVRLADKNNVANAFYPNGYNTRNVVDGDYNTHWTARAWWEDPGHIITFDQAYEMDHVVYVPRLDGNFKKSLNNYSITIWGPDDDLNGLGTKIVNDKKIPGYNSNNGYAVLTLPKSMVKQIKVETYIWAGAPTNTSASEIIFYEYYSVDDEIKALFADDTYSTISSQASQDEIERLRNIVNGLEGHYFVDQAILLEELAMAEALLQGDNSKVGSVLQVTPGRDAKADSSRGFSYQLNDFQPLGISAKAGQKVVLYVSSPSGELPELVATQFYPEWKTWKSSSIKLQEGRNVIEIPQIGTTNTERGGSIYLTYSGDQSDIRVHVKGGTTIPMLSVNDLQTGNEDMIKASIEQYIENLTAYVKKLPSAKRELQVLNTTEIETPNVLLSLPASKVLEGLQAGGLSRSEQVERMYNSLLAWEELIDIQYTVHGLSKEAVEPQNSWPSARINIRYTQMFEGAFMYASSGHIGIGYGSVAGMVQGKPTSEQSSPNALYGWGISHEIGHVIDQRGRVYAETTNNIYSLFAQTYDGQDNIGQSRLEISNKYSSIYEKVSRSLPGKANDLFVGLGMYWQLHLAYDGAGESSMDFYNELHQKYRDEAYRSSLPEGLDQDNLFAVIASDTAGKNLTPFFERWGITISEQAKSYLSDKWDAIEERALYYLNDEARRYRLSGKSGMTGDIQLHVEADASSNDKQVVLNITDTLSDEDLLGYEIYRNGEPIAFTTSKTYTDHIGAANNQSFMYEVVAYDKLLKTSDKVKAEPEVKIVHDGTLSKEGWSYQLDNPNEIIIDMGKVQQTAGIKFNRYSDIAQAARDNEDIYDYKVEVSVDGQDWVQAKVGDFESSSVVQSENENSDVSLLAYFNKPNAPSSDTRIWVYDARYVKVTGSDQIEAMKADVQNIVDIISYPGDNIEISTGAIGYLQEDFIYMDGDTEEKIAKGTLVVTGSYRGDPVYNIISLKGKYSTQGQFGENDVQEERFIDGYGLMFAEIPEDGAVSEISDGFWLFVPTVDGETVQSGDEQLPETGHEASVLPDQIKAELYRTLDPDSLENAYKVSDTIWMTSPNEETMPLISLKGDK